MIMNQKTIKKISILFFLLFSFYLTLNFLGIENLYFNNIDWLLGGGDISNAQNGWTFFKNDKWHFPIGKNPNYGLEISTSIIFSDSIPLFSFNFQNFQKLFKCKLSIFFSLDICMFFPSIIFIVLNNLQNVSKFKFCSDIKFNFCISSNINL